MADEGDETKLEHIKHALESRRQLRQATINFEHAALRVLFLLNGGGLIAFLTFLGTGAGKGLENKWTTTASLIVWLIGLVLAGFATGFGYKSQFKFYKAHGDYQRVQVGLMEYPLDEDLSDEVLIQRAKESSDYAQCHRDRAHRFGFSSLVAFTLGAAFSIFGYAY